MNDQPLPDMVTELLRTHAELIAKETERWLWKAIAQGVGNRVWRSEPEPMPRPEYGWTYRFAVLKPGELPPGVGVIYGPISGGDSSEAMTAPDG
jgi:hypothetical protein